MYLITTDLAEQQNLFLLALKQGAPIALALDYSGLSQGEYDHLITNDPEFERQAKQIHARSTLELTYSIRIQALEPKANAAEMTGDWKAAAWLLEHSPQSSHIYNPPKEENININIRDILREALMQVDGKVIENANE